MDIILHKDRLRPVAILQNYHNMLALVDTGAVIPVWTGGYTALRYNFNIVKIKEGVVFTGFGSTAKGDLYRLSNFKLGDLYYPDLPVIVTDDKNLKVQMILSASMFSRLSYEINDRDKYLRITVPEGESTVRHLEIKDSNGRLHILCNQ